MLRRAGEGGDGRRRALAPHLWRSGASQKVPRTKGSATEHMAMTAAMLDVLLSLGMSTCRNSGRW